MGFLYGISTSLYNKYWGSQFDCLELPSTFTIPEGQENLDLEQLAEQATDQDAEFRSCLGQHYSLRWGRGDQLGPGGGGL